MKDLKSFFAPVGASSRRTSPRKPKANVAVEKASVPEKGEKNPRKKVMTANVSRITPPRKRRKASRKAIIIDGDEDVESENIDDDDFDDDEDFIMEDEPEKTARDGRKTKRRAKRAIVMDDEDDDAQGALIESRVKQDTDSVRKRRVNNSPSKNSVSKGAQKPEVAHIPKESSPLKPKRRSSIGTIDEKKENRTKNQTPESWKEEFIKDCKESSKEDSSWEFSVPDEGSDCLTNVTVVFTGELVNMPERNEAEDLVKRHGGRVTSGVSGKTTLLVKGENPGNTKTQKAESLGTMVLEEEPFFRLVMKRYHRVSQGKPAASKKPQDDPNVASRTKCQKEKKVPKESTTDQENMLWTVKYAPQTVDDIVANATNVKSLVDWLKSWKSNYASLSSPDFRKAVLLSGPPGVGKTSSAILACKELGMQAMQVNASDARNKAQKDIKGGIGGKTSNIIKEYVTNRVLSGSAEVVLIMDEVDGMSAGDRGGVADLIQTIKSSKIPIVCIANDKYSQKLRSLLNHAMTLDYRKPTKDQIAKRMQKIATEEGLKAEPNALQQLAEECNGDIRLVLNSLQIYRTNHSTMRYDDVKGEKGAAPQKDLAMSVFSAMDAILHPRHKNSLGKKLDLVFHDMDLIPLMYQENYVNYANDKNESVSVDNMAYASNAISAGEIINSKIRSQQAWGLMPFAAFMSVVLGTSKCSGSREPMFPQDYRNRFPSWLGKNSNASKNRRLISQIQLHALASSSHFRMSSGELRLATWKLLQKKLIRPLQAGIDGIEEVFTTMQSLGLDREDWGIICEELGFCGIPKKDRPAIETKVKTAFSRHVNKMIAPGLEMKKPSNNRAIEPVNTDNDVVAQEEVVAEEEDQDEDEQAATKSKRTGTSRGSGAGRGRGGRASKSYGRGRKGGRGR